MDGLATSNEMKLIIESVGISLTPSLREAVQEQMDHLEKFFKPNDSVELRVEVGKPSAHHKKGDVFYAEANLKISGTLLRATEQDSDIHLAIDTVRHVLERQLIKHKERILSSRHRVDKNLEK